MSCVETEELATAERSKRLDCAAEAPVVLFVFRNLIRDDRRGQASWPIQTQD